MRAISFHDGWTCRHTDAPGAGVPVLLPHDAMLAEPRSLSAECGLNGGWYDGCCYTYAKTFTVPAEAEGERWLLEFEGVMRNAQVLLNGAEVAYWPYGYTNFFADLTGKLVYGGENTLEVIADNSDQPNSRWYTGSGIYRPVTLWVGPREEHILPQGVRVSTRSIDPPVIHVTVERTGDGTPTLEVLDGENVLASARGAEADIPLPGVTLWHPDHPALYTLRVTLGADVHHQPFGVRSLTWGDDGLKLNGARILLRGACIHHDNGILGAATWSDAEERRVRLLKENGYNAIRSAHNPCSKALLDACDRLGMLMMDELVDCWYIHKTKYDYVCQFEAWWQKDLKAMVDKDFSHPSVVLYSTGNEVGETAQEQGIALTRTLTDYLHGLDPTRPVTCGINIFFNFLISIGMGQYTDEKAEKEAARAEKLKAQGKQAKEASVGSKFFNDLAGLLGDEFMKRGATIPPCDWRTRDAFANMDIAGYNYGIYRYKSDLKKYPHRLILGSETFCRDAALFMELAKDEPRLIGDFVWAGTDYLGEVGIGAWEYADYAPQWDNGPGWVSAGSGRIDLVGNPLGEALYTRVALAGEPGPYLAVRPVNHTGEKHSPSAWKMTNAMPSWSWPGCEGKTAEVEIYARGARAVLLLNGEKAAEKKLKDCRCTVKLPYRPGRLEAVIYDESGAELSRSSLTSAGPETQLRLTAEAPAAAPGHLAFVHIDYTDGAGILKPLERHRVSLEVTGGTLLALGHACPYNADGFLGADTDTYWGQALAVVLAEGDVTLTARDGARTAVLTLPAR